MNALFDILFLFIIVGLVAAVRGLVGAHKRGKERLARHGVTYLPLERSVRKHPSNVRVLDSYRAGSNVRQLHGRGRGWSA